MTGIVCCCSEYHYVIFQQKIYGVEGSHWKGERVSQDMMRQVCLLVLSMLLWVVAPHPLVSPALLRYC